jgi:hypothetical protein
LVGIVHWQTQSKEFRGDEINYDAQYVTCLHLQVIFSFPKIHPPPPPPKVYIGISVSFCGLVRLGLQFFTFPDFASDYIEIRVSTDLSAGSMDTEVTIF